MSNFLDWILKRDDYEVNKDTIIKHMKSKGPGNDIITLTVENARNGYVLDSNGYKNEVVLFLRKDKKDR